MAPDIFPRYLIYGLIYSCYHGYRNILNRYKLQFYQFSQRTQMFATEPWHFKKETYLFFVGLSVEAAASAAA